MYPNPQDVLPLPARPDAEQYRKRAKDLAKACASGKQGALHEWAQRWLQDLARLVESGETMSARDTQRIAADITGFAHTRLTRAGCALSEAQFIIARVQGFESWPKFMRHLEQLAGDRTETSTFERAADAIIHGDLATLRQLLRDDPRLAHARSTREHHATLLHYVAANGVENYRQVTPPNIVDIAGLLLDAGTDVNAEADVYGGGATTLGLVVTSAHPRQMKVQNALADLLLERGARVHAGIVRDCLANGCPEAAEHLLDRVATLRDALTLEEAAGLGRVDLVAERWPASNAHDRTLALMMAAWYGRVDVARFLLDQGLDAGVRHPKDGDTALHIASYTAQPALVRLLLERGAPVNAVDDNYGTPPLVWSLHAWLVENKGDPDAHRAVLRDLMNAGAAVRPEWIDDERLRADSELWSVLNAPR